MAPSLPNTIRNAIASGEFSRALKLWEEYAADLAEMARRGSLTQNSLQEAGQLVQWARTTTLTARAHGLEALEHRRAACRVAQAYSGNSAGTR